jgi:putative Ca2+/H+ antiporter (TMEM165/GDT1 family)
VKGKRAGANVRTPDYDASVRELFNLPAMTFRDAGRSAAPVPVTRAKFASPIRDAPDPDPIMEALLIPTGVVALAEIGDKTQLLAFILAARFRKPWPIIAGILCATLVNHGLAGALGAWITSVLSPDVLRWVLGLSFIGMAAWTLIPDKIEEEEMQVAKRLGVFGATLITFFLAEMGDKTQVATIALAAHYASALLVVIGTTLGMLIADVPAVFVGDRFGSKIPMKLVHSIAAGIFATLGVLTLLRVDTLFS